MQFFCIELAKRNNPRFCRNRDRGESLTRFDELSPGAGHGPASLTSRPPGLRIGPAGWDKPLSGSAGVIRGAAAALSPSTYQQGDDKYGAPLNLSGKTTAIRSMRLCCALHRAKVLKTVDAVPVRPRLMRWLFSAGSLAAWQLHPWSYHPRRVTLETWKFTTQRSWMGLYVHSTGSIAPHLTVQPAKLLSHGPHPRRYPSGVALGNRPGYETRHLVETTLLAKSCTRAPDCECRYRLVSEEVGGIVVTESGRPRASGGYHGLSERGESPQLPAKRRPK